MLRAGSLLLLGTCLIGQACVLPRGGATGVEVTWTLREANAVDGPEARRLRTCAGAGVARVELRVEDAGDPAREARFTHGCAAGNPSPAARASEAPEIFLDLRPGGYELAAAALADGGVALAEADLAVELDSHEVTALDIGLTRPTRPLALELAGAASCQVLRATLRYADPAADLFPDAEDPPPVYRAALQSDRGLRLGGQEQACAAAGGGTHLVPDIDPGRYVLDLEVDGRRCSLAVTVEDSPTTRAVDLEKPACGG